MKFNVIATEKKADAGIAEALTHITRAQKAAMALDVSIAAVANRLPSGIDIPQPLLGKIHGTDEFKAYLVRVQREVADLAAAFEQFVSQR